MSYVIHVWDHHPLPEDDDAAAELFERLSDETTPQNPKFVELAEQLEARLPGTPVSSDEDDVLVDFDDASGYEVDWPEGPPDGLTDSAVYGLAMGHDRGIVFPVLAEIAGDLGLTVYDMQSGNAYLPGGRVLTMEGVKPLSEVLSGGDKDWFYSRSQAKLLLAKELKPFLEPHGFRKVKGMTKFVKRYPAADVSIDLPIYGMSRVKISCRLSIKFDQALCEATDLMPSQWIPYLFNLDNLAKRAGCPFSNLVLQKAKIGIDLESPIRLKANVKLIGDFLSAVVPVMEKCCTYPELDREINRLPHKESLIVFCDNYTQGVRELIIMDFAKNPGFEELATQWLNKLPPGKMREWIAGKLAG